MTTEHVLACKIVLPGVEGHFDAMAKIKIVPSNIAPELADDGREPGIQPDGTFRPGGPLTDSVKALTSFKFWFGLAELAMPYKALEEWFHTEDNICGKDFAMVFPGIETAPVARMLKIWSVNHAVAAAFVGCSGA